MFGGVFGVWMGWFIIDVDDVSFFDNEVVSVVDGYFRIGLYVFVREWVRSDVDDFYDEGVGGMWVGSWVDIDYVVEFRIVL